MARKAYEDILVSPVEEDGTLKVFIVNDRQQSVKGTLTVALMDMNGKIIRQTSEQKMVDANVSACLWSKLVKEWLGGEQAGKVLVHAVFKTDKTYDNIYALLKQKEMTYPEANIATTVVPAKGGMKVTLKADKFVRAAYLSIDGIDNFFSDNYFDLLPGETKTVLVKTSLPLEKFKQQLKVEYYQ